MEMLLKEHKPKAIFSWVVGHIVDQQETAWPGLYRKSKEIPYIEFFYFSDDGYLVALKYDNWKMVFMGECIIGTLQFWAEPFIPLYIKNLQPA